MFKTILVPIDGSSHAEKALKVAAELARSSGATLQLLNVAEATPDNIGILVGGSTEPMSQVEREKLAEGVQRAGLQVIGKAKGAVDLAGLEVKELVRQGRPGERIIEAAEELGADAIVMGSRGMSDLRGMVVGSVSHRVSHTAGCTVITVT
ncbi:universal stress protein [Halomonas sp. BM-2019]|uniref:universal stress protein n=1 Tax=Halomonas sp. BM-2019 TaxID=2811227 RepID=UPI001B3C2B4C|nr:MAG: universal stress protein [Halomonas sp. BM-2019]